MIPLNNDALGAIISLRRNVKRLFGDLPSPDWYIFPHAEGNSKPNPTRPMSSWRTAWRSLTRKAGLAGLRFHDLRHHAITELAESSTSEQTIMSIAGHVSARMLAHYSHVRLQAKRVAVSALSNTGERSVTSQSTSQSGLSSQDGNPKSLKNLVDVTGIEPATPCLQSRRGKTLKALSGVAYTENWRNFRSLKCPEVVPNFSAPLNFRMQFHVRSAIGNLRDCTVGALKPLSFTLLT